MAAGLLTKRRTQQLRHKRTCTGTRGSLWGLPGSTMPRRRCLAENEGGLLGWGEGRGSQTRPLPMPGRLGNETDLKFIIKHSKVFFMYYGEVIIKCHDDHRINRQLSRSNFVLRLKIGTSSQTLP